MELDYQLNQWYAGLPPAMQFPLDRVPLQNPVQTVLRLRYFACRTIIFRPYILMVLQDETLGLRDEQIDVDETEDEHAEEDE